MNAPGNPASIADALNARARALFDLREAHLNLDANTVGAPLRGIADRDMPMCTLYPEVRQDIARSFGCESDELAVTAGTTDGLSKALGGLELRAGDEILTTNHEHWGCNAPMAIARDRYGVVIKRVAVPVGMDQSAEDYLNRFADAVTPRTRLLVFAAPTACTGTMLPIPMLTAFAQQHGLISIIDAAHVPGMFNLDFRSTGADFLAGSGNKWQCGPPGTGFLFIRNRVITRYNPNPLPQFWPLISIWYPLTGGLPPRTTGSEPSCNIADYVQNIGSSSLSRMMGLHQACMLWDELGRDRIERYILDLSLHLKGRILERWGSKALYSPLEDRRLLSGLTAFNPFRRPEDVHDERKFELFVERMEQEHSMLVKYTQFEVDGAPAPHHAIRVSTRVHHDHADVDHAVECMAKLADRMG